MLGKRVRGEEYLRSIVYAADLARKDSTTPTMNLHGAGDEPPRHRR
ncbi:uncharacterized protein G2W53_027300 [Senna tora]|uniref:Uncharacterized protein n=1 Tax=Senna tora TaxID=362788 RepID=A0A834TJ41_9FABA|nr:uncharacterized protein G2W53_027300 [Senna tora]